MTIRLESVTLNEPGMAVLGPIDLEVQAAEVFVLLGPNGCGKSTLLRLCIGLLRPTSGSVALFGRPLPSLSSRELEAMRREIGYVFQEDALLSALTVRDNLELPLAYASGMPARARRERVERCLQVVGLREEADRRPAELSLGKRKRAAMARAIVHRPKLLLLDDPTSGLDSLQAYETVALIHELRRETKAACLVASNDATRFLRAADRVAILFGGRLTSIGRPDDVVASDDPWLTEVYERLVRAESIASGGQW